MRRVLAAAIALLPSVALAQDAPARPPARAPDLRLSTLREGLRAAKPDAPVRKAAAAVGLDLERPAHPLVAHRFVDGQVFYVFYKSAYDAFGDRPYVVQRVKKTERSWKNGVDEPETKVTYLVEAFKTLGGVTKGEDEHFGHFHLRDLQRREVVKEYEIGFGEVAGACEGKEWPFGAGLLFQTIQGYQEEPGLYDKTVFFAARPWTLTVSFDRTGAYRVVAPALGLDLPRKAPDPSAATPPPDPTSKDLVLERGVGLLDVVIGVATAETLETSLGRPIEDVPSDRDHRMLSYARSVTVELDPSGRLRSVVTRPGFAGRTKEGIAHGTTRAKVLELLGSDTTAKVADETWPYDGIQLSFDGFDRVSRIRLTRRR